MFGGSIGVLSSKSTLYRLPEPQAGHLVMSMPVIRRISSAVEVLLGSWLQLSLSLLVVGADVFVSSLQRATFSLLLRLPSSP